MNKKALLSAALLMVAASLPAHETAGTPLDAATDKLVRANLTQCEGMTLTGAAFAQTMPAGLSAKLIRSSSPNHLCDGQYLLVTSNGGTYWIGAPWFLGEAGGATIEEKLQSFAWRAMQSNVNATIDRKRSPEGLFRATILQTTEAGKIRMEGLVDPDGRVFFLGPFLPQSGDPAKARMNAFSSLVTSAPAKGAATAPVTVVEFSDFQCPSCKRSSGVGETIVARFGDRVRYVRYDLPLITSHPWAFGASMAGRAIYAQKPELFWSYKKQVYENQDKLNAFVFADFARQFAEDHELDMARYDADVVSPATRDEILNGVGAAFANGVRATPTFMVNGVFVGSDGVEAYVEKLLRD